SKQASKQAFKNKGWLLPDQSLSGRKLHSFSDFQDMDSLCLEKLYQSNFTAAKSNNGLSRIFFDFSSKNVIFQKRKSLLIAGTKLNQNIRIAIYGRTHKIL
ncbi:MAG: hypothetical protein IKB25_14340, partial [Lentisphaeria bacterium]|nr:hypothetical protein [Lentisphaeria bacterium]